MSGPQSELSGYATLPEPELLFAGNKLQKHPLLGLINHGPFGLKYGAPSTLRLALVAPRLHQQKLPTLIRELNGNAKPKEAVNYYPEYPGFSEVFRISIATVSDNLVLTFPDALENCARNGEKHELALLWQFRFGGVGEEFLTVRASLGWRPCEEVEDGLPDGRHARLWRRSPNSFFSVPLL